MAKQNILIQQQKQDGSYNQLYPITNASNVNYTNSSLSGVDNVQGGLDSVVSSLGNINTNLDNYFTKTQTLTSVTSALYNFPSSTVPNDIFNLLSAAALQRTTNQPKYNEVTIDLSTAQVGDIINLPFNGVMTPHIVVNVGNPDTGLYDSSCNGVWLLMQDIYANAVWDAGSSNAYGPSDVNSTYLPDTVLPLYSTAIQNGIVQVKIPYVNGPGNTGSVASGANGLSTKLFLLSGYEVGWTTSTGQAFPVDGAVLSYFSGMSTSDAQRIAYLDGIATSYYLRSPSTNNDYEAWEVNSGSVSYLSRASNQSMGIRPAFIMPTTFTTTVYTDDGGNVYDAQEYYTAGGLYDVLGNLLLTLPGVQIETGSYVGTGTFGEDNPNSLTFGFEPQFGVIHAKYDNNVYLAILTPSCGNATFNNALLTVAANGNTISWYGTDAVQQGNTNGNAYNYVFFG